MVLEPSCWLMHTCTFTYILHTRPTNVNPVYCHLSSSDIQISRSYERIAKSETGTEQTLHFLRLDSKLTLVTMGKTICLNLWSCSLYNRRMWQIFKDCNFGYVDRNVTCFQIKTSFKCSVIYNNISTRSAIRHCRPSSPLMRFPYIWHDRHGSQYNTMMNALKNTGFQSWIIFEEDWNIVETYLVPTITTCNFNTSSNCIFCFDYVDFDICCGRNYRQNI